MSVRIRRSVFTMDPATCSEDGSDATSENNSHVVDIGEPRLWNSYWEEDEDDVDDFTEEEVKSKCSRFYLSSYKYVFLFFRGGVGERVQGSTLMQADPVYFMT